MAILSVKVEIVRLVEDRKQPQRGVMLIEGVPMFTTLELPDLDNKPRQSCIPLGSYQGVRTQSAKAKGDTFVLINVPGRSAILIHPGNTTRDTQGCILIGKKFSELEGSSAISESVLAFKEFMGLLKGIDSLTLDIRHIK